MSGSRAEVQHIFPSITHEGVGLAAEILRKLRAGTGPGKGYYMKAEETAALPGVSAFLAVERLQSHDLTEDEARKRSSVSRPHFRSCLATARHILAASSQPSTPTKRTTRSSPMANPFDAGPSSTSNADQMAELTAKLVTPSSRKRARSGPSRDLSGLLDRTPTKNSTPVKPSPLKQSTTPSKAKSAVRRSSRVNPLDEEEEEEEEEELPATPSKRSRVSLPTPGRLTASVKGKGRATVDTTAFFAAKPDTPAEAKERARRDLETEERALEREMEERWNVTEAKRAALGMARDARPGRSNRKRVRRDWTYHEAPWPQQAEQGKSSDWLEGLMDEIHNWCASNGYPLPAANCKTPSTLKELYLTFNVALESSNGDTIPESTIGDASQMNASEPTVGSEFPDTSSVMDTEM